MNDRGMAGALGEIFNRLTQRIIAIESNPRSEVTGGIQAMLFAALPAAGQPGRLVFVTNGRKVGEGAGAGTGVIAYDDGGAWRRPSDDAVVSA